MLNALLHNVEFKMLHCSTKKPEKLLNKWLNIMPERKPATVSYKNIPDPSALISLRNEQYILLTKVRRSCDSQQVDINLV